ncbi:MAG: hypothetical protein H6708_00020 [Kofleriaceae bacterium]|nr:hypothetical protein [Myxococcales bacterium]MCB9558774.1 hypothetical protein [Kofleriaceae bacterium]
MRRRERAAAAMVAAAVALAALALAGCPRGGTTPKAEDEPTAVPAPVEIDWPDAGVPRAR